MSAIEIAMHKTMPAAKPAVAAKSASGWIAERAIRLSALIAGTETSVDRRPELAGNPWARPIGLSSRR